ncbi:hypothetical protein [Tuwongella immobilis]|uniref:Trm112 family protein n=1 Tax=Tuwongella immobilis TaxID=692036 RepID=A0A6C2YTF5_9BACT|nr:hypothetical protein [Tuwongella immobilis]VIP04694.1 unnamed protein product [Tuwongella immobilis]VTS06747.1 unnamed protein product [Tuwongella immobilis]
MIDPQSLEYLRCPIDPQREATLVLEEHIRVYCSNCRVQFKTREGMINLIPQEAILPDGCERLERLPCQKRGSASKPQA